MRGTERMTLYEALQELAPVPDGLPSDLRARREQACERVYAALRARAPAILKAGHDADDAVATVLMRLIQTGPRGHLDTLRTDAQAEGYLATALRNYQRDLYRRSRRLTSIDANDPLNEPIVADGASAMCAPAPGALEEILEAERLHLLGKATDVVYEEALPAVAGSMRDPAKFRQTVLDVRDLARDATSIDAILSRDGLPPGTTSINRLYQQHRRARITFLERIRAWLLDHPLPSDLDDVVRRLVEYDMTSRVPRGGQLA